MNRSRVKFIGVRFLDRRHGFTLIETVIAALLVGVLAATVATLIGSRSAHGVVLKADQLRRDLSRIQLIAIGQGERLRLTISANGYSVFKCTSPACSGTLSPLIDPASGQAFSVTFPAEDSTSFTASGTLDFDTLGRPQLNGSLVTSKTSFQLGGSGITKTVSVLPLTGYATLD